MENINEKIQKAYLDTIIYKRDLDEERIIDQYFEAIDILEEIEKKIDEKWDKKVDIKKTGEHAGKSIKQIKKEINALKGKPGNKEKMGELIFALRSKEGWPKGEGSTK